MHAEESVLGLIFDRGAVSEKPAPREQERAVCVTCHHLGEVCCAEEFIEQRGESVFVKPRCVTCCRHEGRR